MKEVSTNFSNLTGYDLIAFLGDYATFVEQDSQIIIDFYSGLTDQLPQFSVEEMNRLLREVVKIDQLFLSNKDDFNTADFCDLCDLIGDIRIKLLTIKNTPKWTRSSIVNNNFSSSIQMDVTLNQNQTLEQLASKLGYLNAGDDWIDLATQNNLKEEDYTVNGGLKLKASFQNNLKINILSVVNTIHGQSIYGLDIQKKFEFVDNDLKALNNIETINQAFDIALNLRKGDNPEFPNDGLQSSLIVGQNLNSILYPSIFRQIYQVFSKDDTFKSISVLNIAQKQNVGKDVVQLEVQAQTRIDETITDLILI